LIALLAPALDDGTRQLHSAPGHGHHDPKNQGELPDMAYDFGAWAEMPEEK